MYANIVFIEIENDRYVQAILEEDGVSGLFAHLLQWDYNEDYEESEKPWGNSDKTISYMDGKYVVSYNLSLGYVGLSRLINE